MFIFKAINLIFATLLFGWHLTELGEIIVGLFDNKKPSKRYVLHNAIYAAFGLLWLVSAAMFYGEVR